MIDLSASKRNIIYSRKNINENKLAILGGEKVCKKPIKNSPLIDRNDIKVVNNLMKTGRFSDLLVHQYQEHMKIYMNQKI